VELLHQTLTVSGAFIVRTEVGAVSTMTVALNNGRIVVYHTANGNGLNVANSNSGEYGWFVDSKEIAKFL
jgi:hypothetical protein